MVLKVKEKYDSEMMKLKDLYAKRNEEQKKELLKDVEKSVKTYEEIMVNNPGSMSLLSGLRGSSAIIRFGSFSMIRYIV